MKVRTWMKNQAMFEIDCTHYYIEEGFIAFYKENKKFFAVKLDSLDALEFYAEGDTFPNLDVKVFM